VSERRGGKEEPDVYTAQGGSHCEKRLATQGRGGREPLTLRPHEQSLLPKFLTAHHKPYLLH